jgi:hypothetical protein
MTKPTHKKMRCYSFNQARYTKYSIGGLWQNHRKQDPQHPDALGELDIPKVLLDDLNQQYRQRGKAKISLAAWDNLSQDGENYLTLTGKLPRQTERPCVGKK